MKEISQMEDAHEFIKLSNSWEDRGIEQGIQIGLVEMIIQGLVAKFKKVPTDISEGIQELSTPALKTIALKIMSDDGFKNIDEVREYL